MIIYKDTVGHFVTDVRDNLITFKMADQFKSGFGRSPSVSEKNSWNALSRVRDIIEISGLQDNMIALEYQIPYNQNRIDCLLFGKDGDDSQNIVLLELKQWSSVKAIANEEGNFVETYTGGAQRKVLHPSQQVQGYDHFLKDFIEEFENKPTLSLFSCSYCPNYQKKTNEGLFDPEYEEILKEFPIYTMTDTRLIAEKIKGLLAKGDGFEIFNRFMQSRIRPSKKLLENVTKVISNESVFSLLNEQLIAKNIILSKVRNYQKTKTKSVVIVHGGPGTGKSVIALNVLADMARMGKSVFFACKSKPFIEGLKNLVGKDGKNLFSNLNRFTPSQSKESDIDVLLVDEAHRIGKTSNHQFTPKHQRTDMPQIDQLIRSAKTTVFFIDDRQNVRSVEVGSSKLIKETAEKFGAECEDVQLETQFRCMGSNDYLLWIESVLGYTLEKRILRKNEVFDFKIFNSPAEIYSLLQQKEKEKKNSARIVAGFCWPWSKKLDENGELVKDVVIGEFALPWETHGDISRPPEGYVKWYEWAYKTEGIKQVGCIYTAQGFEFDYVGVIIGDDLKYDEKTNSLIGDVSSTKDPMLRRGKADFTNYVRNIYRTLLSRGMKGCYVYFTNPETRKYFESQIEF